MPVKFNETDLYPPIRRFFEELDYRVDAEVNNCDVAMTKNGELIIIELKKSFNITLLHQALDRQKLTTQVYVAVPRPKKANTPEYRGMLQIASKLEIGLITVAMDSPTRHVEILVFPPAAPLKALKRPDRRERVLTEMAGRKTGGNIGGSTRRKLMTAYREKSIQIACVLEKHGTLNRKELLAYGCDANAYGIVYANHYDWFKRVNKGLYDLSPAGQAMLDGGEFAETVHYFRADTARLT